MGLIAGTRLPAQNNSYPKGYFQFPIYPGQKHSLAGVLGDLRTNHFHGGIDIRTRQVEGLPVLAAAEGYIYKIGVQRTGYGNVIMIRHPNGFSTVYGHLQKFTDSVARYVREEQYRRETFEIDLYPEAGRFNVKKGELIALSGNTGTSSGPHLHFEIRDAGDNYLNPLFFGFPEIRDQTAPTFVSVALRPMDIDSRVNGQFERQVFSPLWRKGKGITLRDTVRATGSIGVELQAFDRMDGTSFRYGLFCIEIKVDDREVFVYNMEKFPNAATRDYNNLIDYNTRLATGERYYRCYVPEGNRFNLYQTDDYKGKIQVSDTLSHQVSIKIYDSFDNISTLTFVLKGEKAGAGIPAEGAGGGPLLLRSEAAGNILKIRADGYRSVGPLKVFYGNGRETSRQIEYFDRDAAFFLYNLEHALPDSVHLAGKSLPLDYQAKIPPDQVVAFTKGSWHIRFDSTSLFDTLYLSVAQRGRFLKINEPGIALRSFISVGYQPETGIGHPLRTHIYRSVPGGDSFVGGRWDGSSISFTTRELGTFYPLTDTVPPRVRLLSAGPSGIRAHISDQLSGIDRFRATVDGQWILMNYEPKTGIIWSEKRDNTVPFSGKLLLEVTDRAGNNAILDAEIREPGAKPVKKAVKSGSEEE